MTFAELWVAMKRLGLLSDARLDFLAALEEQFDGALLSDVADIEAPARFSDYWSAVAAGKSPAYDARGAAQKIAGAIVPADNLAFNFDLSAADYPLERMRLDFTRICHEAFERFLRPASKRSIDAPSTQPVAAEKNENDQAPIL